MTTPESKAAKLLGRTFRESVTERLTSMAEYAEDALEHRQDLWNYMDALRQMLRGEIARINQHDQI